MFHHNFRHSSMSSGSIIVDPKSECSLILCPLQAHLLPNPWHLLGLSCWNFTGSWLRVGFHLYFCFVYTCHASHWNDPFNLWRRESIFIVFFPRFFFAIYITPWLSLISPYLKLLLKEFWAFWTCSPVSLTCSFLELHSFSFSGTCAMKSPWLHLPEDSFGL